MKRECCELDHEKMWKRLLGAMQLGIIISGADGHIWISCIDDDYTLDYILQKAGISLNGKIYNGVLGALACIDECLRIAGKPTLIDVYDDNIQFLGNNEIDPSRINKSNFGRVY